MDNRYSACFYTGAGELAYATHYSDDALSLIAQASLFIEEDYAGGYCEVRDEVTQKIVSTIKRAACE